MDLSKKAKRRESKLKKAKAFLELVGYSTSSSPEVRSQQHLDQLQYKSNGKEIITQPQLQQEGEIKMESDNPKDNNSSDPGSSIRENKGDDTHTEKKTKIIYDPDVFLEMKRIVREKNKLTLQKPKLFLTLENLIPFQHSNNEIGKEEIPSPLYILDLQHLLLYALQGNIASVKPRWCKLLRVTKVSSVVLICLDGLSYKELLEDKDNFSWISQSFQSHVEMVCPEQYNSSADAELHSIPLNVSQIKKINLKVPDAVKKQVVAKLKRDGSSGTMSRVCLLLSSHQMKIEGYPMPILTARNQYRNFVFSKDHYSQVTSTSPLFALDCEMCLTTAKRNELTRVSIIDESREVVYDSLCKPRNKIINYLTKYSGITKEMMEPVVTTLADVQREIKELLPSDAILCGQSFNCDLMALQMFHPYVIDTSIIYNMSGNRSVKAGLRKLTGFFLNRTIQNSSKGHNSSEDALATLDLVKLKIEKGLEFGDATISGVYFPSIETYFLGEENGKKAVTQNLEEASAEDDVKCSAGFKPQTASDYLAANQSTAKSPGNSAKRTHDSDSDEEESDSPEGSSSKKRKLEEGNETTDLNSSNANNPDSSKSANDADTADGTESKPAFKPAMWSGQQQQELFAQKNSVHVSQSFSKLVYDAGRSSCLIGKPSMTSKYEGEPIETITASDDSEVRKSAKLMVQSKEFVWANFSEYKEGLESGQLTDAMTQKMRRRLDHRTRSVVKCAKENTLVVVLATGRQQGEDINNAGVFFKIT